jgi:hypothetical protein
MGSTPVVAPPEAVVSNGLIPTAAQWTWGMNGRSGWKQKTFSGISVRSGSEMGINWSRVGLKSF